MRNNILLLGLFLLLADMLFAQSKIVGFVKLQSSGNEALMGAEVWAIGSAAKSERFSNSKGYFELEFPTKKAGQVIRNISVTLEGYEVVNKKKLESYGLIAQPEDNPLIIVLCQTGNYRRAAASYYQTIFDVGATELKAEKERLEKQLNEERENRANLEKQLEQINAQLEHLPEVAEAAANYFAKIDKDQATQLQQNALKELEAGNIQAALDAMPEEEMDRNMSNALTRKQQLEEELAKTNQAIEQNIENYIFKAKLYVSQANYSAAERLYEKAIAADTFRIEHLYDYALFLEDINRYDKALLWLQKIPQQTTEAWRVANAYSYMGQVYQETGDFENAPRAYEKFQLIYDSLYRYDRNNDFYKKNLAISYSKLGSIYQAQGKFDTALVYFQQRSQLGEELYRDNPKSESLKSGLSISYERLGSIYQAQGKFDTALVYFQQDLKLTEELYRDNPKSESLKSGLSISYERLGSIYQAQGKFDTALVYFQQDLKLTEELYRDNPKSESLKNGLAISYSKLGDIYQAQGKFDTALVYFQQDLKLTEELYRDNPKSESLKSGLSISYERLGSIYQAQGRSDTALFYFQKYSKLGEELYQTNPKSEKQKNDLAISYEKLGSIYQAQGKFDTALVYFQDETTLFEELYRDNPKSLQLWRGLGVSYYKLAVLYEAVDSIQNAVDYYMLSMDVFKKMYEVIGLEAYKSNYTFMEQKINELQSTSNPLLQQLQAFQEKRDASSLPADRVKYQEDIVGLLQPLVDESGDEAIESYTANEYGSLAWYYLFNQQFTEAEQAAQKGIKMGGKEAEWIHTNLALALLYQGDKYEEAKAVYLQFKGQPYNAEKTWVAIFMEDLAALEKEKITHPDVTKIRVLLNED